MQRAEREARLERAKELGRIAYVILRSSEIEGMLEYDGQEKHLRTIERTGLFWKCSSPLDRTPIRPSFLVS
jgi:hypothetical protein